MKNFIQPGDSIDVVAPADVLAGFGVRIVSLFGYAIGDALSGKPLAIQVKGVIKAAKLAGDVMAVGAKVNWNNSNANVQLATATLDGVATVVEAAGNGVTEVKIRLTPV